MPHANTFNFTTERLHRLPAAPAGQRAEYRDSATPGLVLRVTDTGRKTLAVFRWVPATRRPERITIGAWPEVGIDAARKRARQVMGQIAEGRSPAAEKRQLHDGLTLAELFEQYAKLHLGKLKPQQQREARALFDLHVRPARLHTRSLRDITRVDVERLHNTIGREHPRTANKVLGFIKSLYRRAAEWGADVRNPATGIKAFATPSRERFLQPAEFPRFVAALDATEQPYRDLFRLLMLTGVRIGNLLAARFDQFDLDSGVWHVPATEHKNKTAHAVPLLPEAVQIVQRRRKELGKRAVWLWPSDSASGHLTVVHKPWRRLCERAGIDGLTRHDIRRTMGSYITMTGGNIQTVGKALGHKTMAASAVYARLNLDPVRQAMATAVGAMGAAAAPAPGKPRRVARIAQAGRTAPG